MVVNMRGTERDPHHTAVVTSAMEPPSALLRVVLLVGTIHTATYYSHVPHQDSSHPAPLRVHTSR